MHPQVMWCDSWASLSQALPTSLLSGHLAETWMIGCFSSKAGETRSKAAHAVFIWTESVSRHQIGCYSKFSNPVITTSLLRDLHFRGLRGHKGHFYKPQLLFFYTERKKTLSTLQRKQHLNLIYLCPYLVNKQLFQSKTAVNENT